MKNTNKTFWITNISNRDVSLADLNCTIKSMSSVNLLSKNHYLTEEQLEKSLSSGSLFIKRDKIKKRLVPPPNLKKSIIYVDTHSIFPSRQRSIFEVKIQEFEELKISSSNEEELLKEEFENIAENISIDDKLL